MPPQLVSKGSIINHWKKKQAVAIQTAFYNTLPTLVEVSEQDADLAWFLYDLILDESSSTFNLTLNKIVYTCYDDALVQLNSNDPGDVLTFIEQLQNKLTKKLSSKNTASFLGDVDGDPTKL